MSHLDPENPLYQADVNCPKCGTVNHISQVQGDRCPGCGFEFKLFRVEEEDLARDFFELLAGEKYFAPEPDGGYVVLHE